MRILNIFKFQDHAQAAQQTVSFINHCIYVNLALKVDQSTTDMVKSFKTASLVWDFESFLIDTFSRRIQWLCGMWHQCQSFPRLTSYWLCYHITQVHCNKLWSAIIPTFSYHLLSADIQLLSHQAYHQIYGSSRELDDDMVAVHLK